ncbi:MAG: bifunctional DNA primase/polymerase [Chloroflexota bacterium]|nr:bifunctional DNA primase/polymerase [Chloroflexota bacterium]
MTGYDTGNRTLDAALRYAQVGWPVLPLHTPNENTACDCGRWASGGCSSPGKHPRVREGLKEASTDERQLRKWWSMWPQANVGIRTGCGEGPWGPLAVIDIDAGHGGYDSLARLLVDMDINARTVTAKTGSGGMHLLYNAGTFEVHNSAGLLGPGLDVRGLGGYIVAPPSLHASGKHYRWEPGFNPWTVKLEPFPEPLWALLAARRPSLPTKGDWSSGPQVIRQGQRNVMLASLAGTMRRRGMEQEEILAALQTVNSRRCDPPLDDKDIERIAWSVSRYSPEEADCPVTPGGVAISAEGGAMSEVAHGR